jgi:ABC-type sulfate transport system substrate-binding protein
MDSLITSYSFEHEIHFNGFSNGGAPWQNHCVVFTIEDSLIKEFKKEVRTIKNRYSQDSFAVLIGKTKFIE